LLVIISKRFDICIVLNLLVMTLQNVEASQNAASGLSLIIQGKTYQWPHQYITGAQIRNLAGISPDALLYLGLIDPFDDVVIENANEINLARPGIEQFYIKELLELRFENATYKWVGPFITEIELRELLSIGEENEIWLKVPVPFDDELVSGVKRVDLTRPGLEHFYVKKRIVSIRINYKEYEIRKGVHTVTELKGLADVKLSDELDQLIEHRLMALDDSASVIISGGEQFFAHVRDGSSS